MKQRYAQNTPRPRSFFPPRKRRKRRWRIVLLIFMLVLGYRYLQQHGNFNLPLPGAAAKNYDYAAYEKKASTALQADARLTQLPLLLQNNPTWATSTYGTGTSPNTLQEKGCAILSLAMLTSFWRGEKVTPTEILAWAGNRYYVEGAGTSWQIFADYAQHQGWHYENLGANTPQAAQQLAQGHPLIVSVKAGAFTTTGHIMVLAQSATGSLKVYDPNDNPAKQHAFTNYSLTEVAQDVVNYWALFP